MHAEADEQEDQRVGDERRVLPDGAHGHSSHGVHGAPAAEVAEHDGGRDAGHDARHAESLAEQERPVGDDGRQCDLDEMVVELMVHERGSVAHDQAHDKTADRHPGELPRRPADGERVAVDHDGEHDGEQDGGGPVVVQTLGVDERRETLGHAEPAKERDDADRVGGGDERAEQERQRPAQTAEHVRAERGEREGDEHAGDGERHDAAPLSTQLTDLKVERCLEQEDRQEDVEDEVRGEAQRLDVHGKAHGQAHEHESDVVGDADAPRHDGDRRGDDQQEDESLLDPGRRPRRRGDRHERHPAFAPPGLEAAGAGERVLERRPAPRRCRPRT